MKRKRSNAPNSNESDGSALASQDSLADEHDTNTRRKRELTASDQALKTSSRARRPTRPVREAAETSGGFSRPMKAGRVISIRIEESVWCMARLVSLVANATAMPKGTNTRAVDTANGDTWKIRWREPDPNEAAEHEITFVPEEEQVEHTDERAEWRFERDGAWDDKSTDAQVYVDRFVRDAKNTWCPNQAARYKL